MNEYVELGIEDFSLNPLHYLSLLDYSFHCWLNSSGVTLETLQDKQMPDFFDEAKRGGICGIRGDRYINRSNRSIREPASQILYIDANNLYSYAMMQKLPHKGFEFSDTSLYTILKTPDDSDHGYYIICDVSYTNIFKDKTEQLALMPNKRKINDKELGYRERETAGARKEKIILDQNNKSIYGLL